MDLKERLMSKFFSLIQIEKKKMLHIKCVQQENKIWIFETADSGR